jgi:hypothetical protein
MKPRTLCGAFFLLTAIIIEHISVAAVGDFLVNRIPRKVLQ